MNIRVFYFNFFELTLMYIANFSTELYIKKTPEIKSGVHVLSISHSNHPGAAPDIQECNCRDCRPFGTEERYH